MKALALILDGWGPQAEEAVSQLPPGAYVALSNSDGMGARRTGLEMRDSLLVVSAGSFSVWFLFRVPLQGTVAECVQAHHTGALHIDACRIFTTWEEPDRPESWKRSGVTANPEAEKIAAPPGMGIVLHPDGRWPTNLLLVHGPTCQKVGLRKMRSSSGGSGSYQRGDEVERAFNKCPSTVVTNFKDTSGQETLSAWSCESNCPIAVLDEQSGDRKAGGAITTTNQGPAAGSYHGHGSGAEPWEGYADTGGAARFYPQFQTTRDTHEWLERLVGLT